MKIKDNNRLNRLIDNPIARIAVLLILVLFLGAILKPGKFISARNFTSIFKQLAEYGILSLAVFICMMSGGIDLSAVYTANLCGIVSGLYMSANIVGDVAPGAYIILAIVISLGIGTCCGLLNGYLVGVLNVPAMLATLGTGQLFLGISTVITGGKAISGVPSAFTSLAKIKLGILPINFIIFLICAVIMYFIMSKTVLGLKIEYIGTNPKASVFSGINNKLEIIKAYTIAGVLASVSGLISLMRMSSAKPDYGTSYIMCSILICVFGGTNPNGGSGNILGIVLATIVLQMIATLMNMFNSISTFYRDIVWGLLLVAMLILNFYIDKKKSKSR